MKALILSSILLCSAIYPLSKEQQKAQQELKIQIEQDEFKVKMAAIGALVTILIIYFSGGKGDTEALAFDQFLLDFSKK